MRILEEQAPARERLAFQRASGVLFPVALVGTTHQLSPVIRVAV